MKELMKLKTLHDKASEFFSSLTWKKQSFELLAHDEKIYSIIKNMEQMLEEVSTVCVIIRSCEGYQRYIIYTGRS